MNKRKEKVAVYSRSATVTQKNEKSGIDKQVKRCKDYSKKINGQVVAEYSDNGVSGATFNREGLQKMLKDAANGKFNKLIICDVYRLGRFYPLLKKIRNKLIRRNVEIISLDCNFDFHFGLCGIDYWFLIERIKRAKELKSLNK